MSIQELKRERVVWQKKPALQELYKTEFFSRLNENRTAGIRTLEIGGGPGFYKSFSPEIFSSDITVCPWHSMALDGQYLPFRSESLDNIVGLDVIHHLYNPLPFFSEAERALRPSGRIVLIEPWMTPFSYFINRFFMPEDCDLRWKPGQNFAGGGNRSDKKPFEANSAIPYLFFHKHRDLLPSLIPRLRLVKIECFALFGYLLSMGFRERGLLPIWFYPFVRHMESITRPIWRSLAALKALIVLEKI